LFFSAQKIIGVHRPISEKYKYDDRAKSNTILERYLENVLNSDNPLDTASVHEDKSSAITNLAAMNIDTILKFSVAFASSVAPLQFKEIIVQLCNEICRQTATQT
jgi:hypothetical protein